MSTDCITVECFICHSEVRMRLPVSQQLRFWILFYFLLLLTRSKFATFQIFTFLVLEGEFQILIDGSDHVKHMNIRTVWLQPIGPLNPVSCFPQSCNRCSWEDHKQGPFCYSFSATAYCSEAYCLQAWWYYATIMMSSHAGVAQPGPPLLSLFKTRKATIPLLLGWFLWTQKCRTAGFL